MNERLIQFADMTVQMRMVSTVPAKAMPASTLRRR